jgi:hypothetical protein
MIKEKLEKKERFYKLKEIARYQLLVLNEKDFIKAIKKLNDSIYLDKTKKLK